MKSGLLLYFLFFTSNLLAQEDTGSLSNLLFWTAQKWPCEFLEVEVYDQDTNLLYQGKLRDRFTENRIPNCEDEQTLILRDIAPGFYFFVAECYKEECYVCHGEGSYWQPIVQDKSTKSTGIKSKANMEGTWRTCHVCGGDGASSSTMWIDSLTLKSQQCRSILLK